MGKLGMKMNKAFSSLGNKLQKVSTKIGDKTNNILKETKGVAQSLATQGRKIGGMAENAFDKTKNFVNTIPDINRKAINLGNKIIDKSGNVTNILRKASGIAGSLTSGLANLGGDIPVVGSVLKAGSKATNLLAKGAKRLDNTRDKAEHKLDKYEQVSKDTIGDIEKINSRKKFEAQQTADESNNNVEDYFA